MVRTILGGLLGGVAIFIIGFLFWGTPLSAIAYSRADSQASANLQASLAQTLTPTGTGVYIVPDPATAEGTILYGKGPVAHVFYNISGFPVTDSTALVGGLILALVIGVLIALTLHLTTVGLMNRFRASLMFAFIAALWIDIGQAIFNHVPWSYSIYLGLSDFVALAAAGLIASKIMGETMIVTHPTSETSIH